MSERLIEKIDRLGAEAGIETMTPEIRRFALLVRQDTVAQWPDLTAQQREAYQKGHNDGVAHHKQAVKAAQPEQDLIPKEDLFVCGQMGAHVTRVYAKPEQESKSTIRALTEQCAALVWERDEFKKQVQQYEKNGVTCQTYRHKVEQSCAECNVNESYTTPPKEKNT